MYFAITDSKVLSSLILSLSLDRDLYLIESNLTVAKWTSMCRICEFRMEPSINALGMEEMMTEGDLPHRCSFLEFLEADHALALHEFVYSLVIGLLVDQTYHLVHSLFVVCCKELLLLLNSDNTVGVVSAPIGRRVLLVLLGVSNLLLLYHLTLLDTESQDGADAHAHEGDHQHKEDKGDDPEG